MSDQAIVPYSSVKPVQSGYEKPIVTPIATTKPLMKVSPEEGKRLRETAQLFVKRCKEQHEGFQKAYNDNLTGSSSWLSSSRSHSADWWSTPSFWPSYWPSYSTHHHTHIHNTPRGNGEETSPSEMAKTAFKFGVVMLLGAAIPLGIFLKNCMKSFPNYVETAKLNSIYNTYGKNLPRALRGNCKELVARQMDFDTKMLSKDAKYLGSTAMTITGAVFLIFGSMAKAAAAASFISMGTFLIIGGLFFGLFAAAYHWHDSEQLMETSRNALRFAKRISI